MKPVLKKKRILVLVLSLMVAIAFTFIAKYQSDEHEKDFKKKIHATMEFGKQVNLTANDFGSVGYVYPWTSARPQYVEAVRELVRDEDEFVRYELVPILLIYQQNHRSDWWWNTTWDHLKKVRELNSRREMLAGYNTRVANYGEKNQNQLQKSLFEVTYPKISPNCEDRIAYVMLKYLSQKTGYWSSFDNVKDVLSRDSLVLNDHSIKSGEDVRTLIANMELLHDSDINKICNLSRDKSSNIKKTTLGIMLGIIALGLFIWWLSTLALSDDRF